MSEKGEGKLRCMLIILALAIAFIIDWVLGIIEN